MDDTIPTRLAYDATQRFVSVGPHTLRHNTDISTTGRYETMKTQHVVSTIAHS